MGDGGKQVIRIRISLDHTPRISIVYISPGKAPILSDRLAEMGNRLLDTAANLQRAAQIQMLLGGRWIGPQGGLAATHRFINAPEKSHRPTQINICLGEFRLQGNGLFIMLDSFAELSFLPQ